MKGKSLAAFGIRILMLTIIVGFVPATQMVYAAADWWPTFHHDVSHTGASTSTAPTANQTLWTYVTGGAIGTSSPAVVEGVVYVGSTDHKVYALNAANGAHIWNYTTGDVVGSSPSVANGIVYVGSNDNKTYALNASSGAFIWSYTTAKYVTSSPAVANGLVYFGSYDKKVYALNATNGGLVWSFATGAEVTSSPAVANGRLFVGSSDSKVYCLNASTGDSLWNFTTYNSVTSSPAVADGRVFAGSQDASLYCLNASTGDRIWQYADVGILSSPAVANGTVYEAQGGGYPRTKIQAFNAANGTSIWNYTTGASVVSSPAVADGKVYVGSTDAKVYAINSSTGALVWDYQTGSGVRSSPAIAEGKLYIGSDDSKVYAFSSLPTPTFALSSNATSVIQSGFFKLTGTLSVPRTSPPNITLQWSKDSSGFNYQQTFDTMANGTYVRDIAFTETGNYQFRAIWPGDSATNSATSNIVAVTVTVLPIPELGSWAIITILTFLVSTAAIAKKKLYTR